MNDPNVAKEVPELDADACPLCGWGEVSPRCRVNGVSVCESCSREAERVEGAPSWEVCR